MSDDHDHGHEHDHEHPHPHPEDKSGIHFDDVIPILNVANVAASLDYYTQVLGFSVDFAWSQETEFGPSSAPPTCARSAFRSRSAWWTTKASISSSSRTR